MLRPVDLLKTPAIAVKGGGIVVPGLNGSEPAHWQSAWQRRIPWLSRIEVGDWSRADIDRWRAGLHQALDQSTGPVVLIGHSFGALASAIVAAERPESVAAVFLVAPADPDKFAVRHLLPHGLGDTAGLLVGSLDDPWMAEAKARALADQLGADYHLAGAMGHINVAAGVGDWLSGLTLLHRLLDSIGTKGAVSKGSGNLIFTPRVATKPDTALRR
jgi:uncharacterized protein